MRGAGLSTAAIGVATVLQVLVMVAVCAVVLIDRRGHLSGTPFAPSHLNNGLAGLSAGFPLALYMMIGWENAPALAEETRDPRRTIPRALFTSVGLATALFVLFAYATIVGFHYDTGSIGRASVPFLEMADHYLGGAAILAWLAGIVVGSVHAGRRGELAGAGDLRRRPLGPSARPARQVPAPGRDTGQRTAGDDGRRAPGSSSSGGCATSRACSAARTTP